MRNLLRTFFAMCCLISVFITGNVTPAYALSGDTHTLDEIQTRLEFFHIINYESSTFSGDGTLTRGKMAEIIGRLHGYGYPHGGVPIEDCFADVPYAHPDYYWILIARNELIINGDENGCFRPDERIKEIDAVKMLLSFAGYDWMAAAFGGYPIGYEEASKILKLSNPEHELSENAMTKEILLPILNNFLDIFEIRKDENGTLFISEPVKELEGTGTMKDWLPYSLRKNDPFVK